MNAETPTRRAASLLWAHWSQTTRIDGLPAECRPSTREEGYAIQAEIARLSGDRIIGWKIAATSAAGQRHIGVDSPLAGPLFSRRELTSGGRVPMTNNLMRVAEAEFAFCMARSIPETGQPFTVDHVMAAVGSLHPAIEIPDSRYNDFATVGAPQLIADCACAQWFVIGAAAPEGWRTRDLVTHPVTAFRNGDLAGAGSGSNVLGDPRIALTWLANELAAYGHTLREGDIVMTGTCAKPVAIEGGDLLLMDFGEFGTIDAVCES